MATSKPDLTRVWAETAPGANVVDPDVTTPGKVEAGWTAEVPPFEHFNFLQQWFSQGLAHLNEEGIAVWDTSTLYPVNGLAKGSDGNIYKAILEQSGNDPVIDVGTNWKEGLGGGTAAFASKTDAAQDAAGIAGAVIFVTNDDGGIFKYIDGLSVATYSDDDATYCGTHFIPNGGDGSAVWLRFDERDIVRPEWYGAVADDTTESGVALQKALTKGETDKLKVVLSNGGYLNNTTNLLVTDRITIEGQNKEDTFIHVTSALTGTILNFDGNGSDPEEYFLRDFRIQNDSVSAITRGLYLTPSYGRLTNIIVKTTTDFSEAAIDTNAALNINQMIFDNVEVRSQSNPGGTMGLRINRGTNIVIHGGYYGDYDTDMKLGDGVNIVTNIEIGGGVIFETFDPQNAANATCLEVAGVGNLQITSARFQTDAAGQRGIKVTGPFRGGRISGNFDGTGTAVSAIEFDGNASEEAVGIELGAVLFNSISFPVTTINGAEPDINDGYNHFRATGNNPAFPEDLADGDTTPNVGMGNTFITTNTAPTLITDLDGVDTENRKTVYIRFGDTNTTINFSGAAGVRGNGGVNWTPVVNDMMICHHINGAWYCTIS